MIGPGETVIGGAWSGVSVMVRNGEARQAQAGRGAARTGLEWRSWNGALGRGSDGAVRHDTHRTDAAV